MKNIKQSILIRVRLVFLFITLVGGAVLWKVWNIQYFSEHDWEALQEKRKIQNKNLIATRGNIYSTKGSLLSTSIPKYEVRMDMKMTLSGKGKKYFMDEVDSLALMLSKFFKDKTQKEYLSALKTARIQNKRYFKLGNRRIKYHEKQLMEQWPVFRHGQMATGIIFEKKDERFKPFRHLARRTIGNFNDSTQRGQYGLEYSFNDYLTGIDGEALKEKVEDDNWAPIYGGELIKPTEGCDIVTTIDVDIQDVAEAALIRVVEENEADNGCAIVMEVATGEIKAIANWGKNRYNKYYEWYNYAVAKSVNPGSTFKLPSMMALLEEADIDPVNDSVETGNGRFKFYDTYLTDSRPGGYGKLSVQEVFEHSSNIGVAKLVMEHFGKDLGSQERFIDYLTGFGLTSPLEFQMVGAAVPKVSRPHEDAWSGITLPWMSIGYEVEISPLHMLTFYNGVANNGRMMSPLLVKSVKAANDVVKEFKPVVLQDRLCSKETLVKLKKMLEGAVQHGTAMNLRTKEYKIAGKTGTAQKIKGGKYVKEYYTSFAGYFPADRPKYSCIVVVDNPKMGKTYGADVAGPVFREIADKIYATDLELHGNYEEKPLLAGYFPVMQSGYYDDMALLAKELKVPMKKRPDHAEWVKASIANDTIVWKNLDIKRSIVPNVTGMTLRDAIYILENAGLKVKFDGIGRVEMQSQLPGQKLIVGSEIRLQLGS